MQQTDFMTPQPKKKNQDVKILVIVLAGLVGFLGLAFCCVVIAVVFSTSPVLALPVVNTPGITPACPEVPGGWELLLSDNFEGEHLWPEQMDFVADAGLTQSAYENGKYTLAIDPSAGMVYWETPLYPLNAGDFFLTVEGQQVEGTDNGHFGVYFRESGPGSGFSSYYYFSISGSQDYSFWLNHVQWKALIDWTQSPAIRPNETNKVTILAEGTHFIFCINDQWVAEFDDIQKASGLVGLMIGAYDEGDPVKFEMDNFIIYAPPK